MTINARDIVKVKLNNPQMGTEKYTIFNNTTSYQRQVKLNNPQMGTEKCNNSKHRLTKPCPPVKLNNPQMGTEKS